MSTHSLFPLLQSAYRKDHSTETAVLKVKNDLLLNMNNGHVTILVLLDLSTAFDTVDHNLLLQKLQSVIGIQGTALSWFQSYLGKRSQQISINGTLSRKFYLQCGIPQGSCLEPLLFTIYLSKLFEILKHHLPTAHAFMDDSQLYLSFSPAISTNQADAISAIETCIHDIRQWMLEDKLMLNDDKTEVLLIGTLKQLAKTSIESIKVGEVDVKLINTAHNLGIWFNNNLTMNTDINKASGSAFFYLYYIKRTRKYLTSKSAAALVHAFITCRVDFYNSLYYGPPDYQHHCTLVSLFLYCPHLVTILEGTLLCTPKSKSKRTLGILNTFVFTYAYF